eukprot:4905410-Amphidinium_carterae.2
MQSGVYGLVDEAQTIQERQQQRADGISIPRPSNHSVQPDSACTYMKNCLSGEPDDEQSENDENLEHSLNSWAIGQFDFDVGLLELSGVS